MKRCALTSAAGPTNSGFVQKGGQAAVQQAHRMHFVVSSKRSRSSMLWRRSFVGRRCMRDQKWLQRGVLPEEEVHIHNQVLDNPVSQQRFEVILLPASLTNTLQARRLRPLILIPSEPQMPCAQERR